MLSTLVGILGAASLAVFGWTVQLGNRVSVLESEYNSLHELINTRFNDVGHRLDRIEDILNGKV